MFWRVSLGALLFAAGVVFGRELVVMAQGEPPMFLAGQEIGVVWDCLPQAVSPQPCYAEVLRVLHVRSDGWLVVVDDGGEEWTVRQDRMIGFQRDPKKTAQVALR